jgi:DNA repair exonuclease SbcCD ATPase subunit
MAKRNPAGKTHSLKDARHPVLVRQSGERLVAQSELGQLQDKREHLIAQLDEIDNQIMALKKKRQAELMAELEELGLSVPTSRFAGEKKLQRQRDPSKPCPVCGELGHDARRHRKERLTRKTA